MKRCDRLKASVIIPVYNQKDTLLTVLSFMQKQTCVKDEFEIIIVDDGSTDGLHEYMTGKEGTDFSCDVWYLRQGNKGRAAARNAGAEVARGEQLIFCDADRFPNPDFVRQHLLYINGCENIVTIGCPWEYFGNQKLLKIMDKDTWEGIVRYARKPLYYAKTLNLYAQKGMTESGIAWTSFLVGNASVSKRMFEKVGGFDEQFRTWGFEHFDLALRMQREGADFRSLPECSNYHIPHPRESGFYQKMIQQSIQIMEKKYSECDFTWFEKFFFGKASLQNVEEQFSGSLSSGMKRKEPIFYKAFERMDGG